jgi:hypothetical protein
VHSTSCISDAKEKHSLEKITSLIFSIFLVLKLLTNKFFICYMVRSLKFKKNLLLNHYFFRKMRKNQKNSKMISSGF